MSVNYLDPINIIVLDEMEKMGKKWESNSANWHKVFLRSLKKFWIFPQADAKWTYWTFMQPGTRWPTKGMTVKNHLMLRFAKLISHLNPKQVYVDRGFGRDPETPDDIFTHDDVAKGLKLWAVAFEQKVFKKLMSDFEVALQKGSARIIRECPEYFEEPCTSVEARSIFYNRVMKLAKQDAINVAGFTNKAILILQDLYRV